MVGAHAGLASAAALMRRLDREPRSPVVLYSSVSDRQARNSLRTLAAIFRLTGL